MATGVPDGTTWLISLAEKPVVKWLWGLKGDGTVQRSTPRHMRYGRHMRNERWRWNSWSGRTRCAPPLQATSGALAE